MHHYRSFTFLLGKTRGRFHEDEYSQSPKIWARHLGEGQPVRFLYDLHRGNEVHVATLFPDNSLTINVRGWHTQLSCKIIRTLVGIPAFLHKGRIWVAGVPIGGDVIQFDTTRRMVTPEPVRDMADMCRTQLAAVTADAYSARTRFMVELGTWSPRPAVTARVLEYAKGRLPLSALSQRDILTCIADPVRVMRICMEEVA